MLNVYTQTWKLKATSLLIQIIGISLIYMDKDDINWSDYLYSITGHILEGAVAIYGWYFKEN